jgi:hypothetical protein
MSLTEIVKVVMPLFAAGFSYELAKKTQQKRDDAAYNNNALATQRMMLAGEALAVAAELGAAPAVLAPYILSYRAAASAVVADEEVPADAEFEVEDIIAEATAAANTPDPGEPS